MAALRLSAPGPVGVAAEAEAQAGFCTGPAPRGRRVSLGQHSASEPRGPTHFPGCEQVNLSKGREETSSVQAPPSVTGRTRAESPHFTDEEAVSGTDTLSPRATELGRGAGPRAHVSFRASPSLCPASSSRCPQGGHCLGAVTPEQSAAPLSQRRRRQSAESLPLLYIHITFSFLFPFSALEESQKADSSTQIYREAESGLLEATGAPIRPAGSPDLPGAPLLFALGASELDDPCPTPRPGRPSQTQLPALPAATHLRH